jgi:phosphonate transport system permease protein
LTIETERPAPPQRPFSLIVPVIVSTIAFFVGGLIAEVGYGVLWGSAAGCGLLGALWLANVHLKPIEQSALLGGAVTSAGGGHIARMRFAVRPQVMPNIVAYWLYRFEINVRASAVLGIIGAGGIGAELVAQLNFRRFDRAGTVLLLTVVTVLLVDTVSGRLRRRIISGHREPGPVATLQEANWWQRVLAGVVIATAVAFVIFLIVQLETTV